MCEKVVYVSAPDNCQSCGKPFDGNGPMYDARVKAWGMWGNICQGCFDGYGCVLGTGLGQKYELQRLDAKGAKGWVKIAG
jgi:hypothetical protein